MKKVILIIIYLNIAFALNNDFFNNSKQGWFYYKEEKNGSN